MLPRCCPAGQDSGVDAAHVKAFRLMVDRSVTWADWDEELLAIELQELNASDFELKLPIRPDIASRLFAARRRRVRRFPKSPIGTM